MRENDVSWLLEKEEKGAYPPFAKFAVMVGEEGMYGVGTLCGCDVEQRFDFLLRSPCLPSV